MIRVLFVCHGNICRSPLAQSFFTYKINQLGLADQFYIEFTKNIKERSRW